MKADAFPAVVPPELDVPSWVPESIAQFARTKYAADVRWTYEEAIRKFEPENDEVAQLLADQVEVRIAYADIVREDLANIADHYHSLIGDRRMSKVWRELTRLRNGAFLYPARAPSSITTAKKRQQAAMLELFKAALACRNHSIASTTRAQAEQQRQRYIARADELDDDAITMLTQHLDSKERSALGRALLAAAKAYRQYASAIRRAQSALPERKCDAHARAVVRTIADEFQTLFGSPMYGLTATIASVVLNRPIDPGTVRYWCPPCS